MGAIDLDPATDHEANQRVLAPHIMTEHALEYEWCVFDASQLCACRRSRVFLNPPGRQVRAFWDHLMCEYDRGNVEQAFWVGFNMDHLRALTFEHVPHPLEFYWCIPRKRIAFDNGTGVKRPSHPNYLVWVPPEETNDNWQRFCEVMGEHGRCFRGERGYRLRSPEHRGVFAHDDVAGLERQESAG